MTRLLFIGDIVGRPGRDLVARAVRPLIAAHGIDLVIANGENAAAGFGLTRDTAEQIFAAGVQVMTSGNHIWDKKEVLDYIPREPRLIRVDEVVYFEADARYTRVVYRGGDALIRVPLKELVARLDPKRFWQVHRSVIVNERCIASAVRVDEGQMVLTLRERDERLPVSRPFQSLFNPQ